MRLNRKAEKGLNGLDQRDRAKMQSKIEHYARHGRMNSDGTHSMPPELFQFEARLATGRGKNEKIGVFAFKIYKKRLYGVIVTPVWKDAQSVKRAGKETFLGLEFDPAKKQDRANQDMLKQTALAAAQYLV